LMYATARPARRQESWCATSAAATWKRLCRRASSDFTIRRLSLMLCVPGRLHSTRSTPTTIAPSPARVPTSACCYLSIGLEPPQGGCGSGRLCLHGERLDDVAFLNIVELLQAHAALESFQHFPDVLLEAAQRADGAFMDHDPIPNQARLGPADDAARGHVAARDSPHPADGVDFPHRHPAEHHLDHLRREQPRRQLLDVLEHLVDD